MGKLRLRHIKCELSLRTLGVIFSGQLSNLKKNSEFPSYQCVDVTVNNYLEREFVITLTEHNSIVNDTCVPHKELKE